jgi:HPt (histidine-containing phosphotransfer) domain-containing protein
MDFSQLARNLGLDDDEFLELVILLVDTGRDTLAKLEAGLSRGDVEAARREAHTLKGAAGNLGFMAMHSDVQALEDAIKAGKTAEIDPLLARVKRALEALGQQVA